MGVPLSCVQPLESMSHEISVNSPGSNTSKPYPKIFNPTKNLISSLKMSDRMFIHFHNAIPFNLRNKRVSISFDAVSPCFDGSGVT